MFFLLFFVYFSLSLEDLIKFAEENSPYLNSLKNEAEAKEIEILPSSSLPNPMLEMMYQNVGFDKFSFGKEEMSMFQFKLEQNLLYPQKRDILKEIAKDNLDISLSFYEIAKAEIRKRIREIYAEIYSLNKEKEGLDSGLKILNSLKIAKSGSISSGEGNQEELLKIEIMSFKLESRLKEIEKDIFLSYEELKRITGYKLNLKDMEILNLPEFEIDGDFIKNALENSPLIKYYSQILKLKEEELVKKKLDLKPDFIVFSSLGLRGELSPVFSFGASIEFPFWKKKKEIPLILSQEKAKEGAKNMLEESKLKVQEEVNGAVEEILNLNERIKIYLEGYLKTLSLSIDASISLYLSGKGDYEKVIENINQWIEGMVEKAKMEAERFKEFSKILFHLNE